MTINPVVDLSSHQDENLNMIPNTNAPVILFMLIHALVIRQQ